MPCLIRCLLLFGLAVTCHAPAVAGDLPVRKPGQWTITSISATHGMVTQTACIGPDDSIAAVTSPGACTPPEVQHAGDQVIVNVRCTTAQGRETTSTLFTGDFTTWYRGIVKMSFDPPAQGRANLGITLDARYIGDCVETAAPGAGERLP